MQNSATSIIDIFLSQRKKVITIIKEKYIEKGALNNYYLSIQ